MKQSFFFILISFFVLSLYGCESKIDNVQEVSVSFAFDLYSNSGNSMTKATNADIFGEFYRKIVSAELVEPSYRLVLTELSTGAEYEFNGFWNSPDMITLRTGKYHITGNSTASGDNVQKKCSFVFEEILDITSSTSIVVLSAKYDCSLLIFNSGDLISVSNFNGEESDDFFTFNSYKYAFVNNALYNEGKQDLAYIKGTYSNGAEFKYYTGALNLEKGKYYVYNSVTATFVVPEMEDGHLDGVEEENSDIVNLSKNGTSNCYIADKNGKYSFNATVKGNGQTSIGIPVTASVVWETFNNSSKPNRGDVVKNVVLENGTVVFETSGNDGNALIAVHDQNGTIIWSWHIWVTGYCPEVDYDTYVGFEGVKVMDRNLGAMSSNKDATSVGLVYQWGRKEPFMGCINNNTFQSTVEMLFETTSSDIGTDEYAISNPYTFIFATRQGRDWRYISDNSAWGINKTELDPCPVGWKMPAGGSDGLWKNFTLGSFDSVNDGMLFDSSCASPDVWMPAQGFMPDSESYYAGWWQSGYEGRYWTVTTLDDTHSEFFYFKSAEISASHSVSGWSTHCSRANGMAVRCVEDK